MNWDEIEKEAGSNFKPTAAKGDYEATVAKVILGKTTSSGAYPLSFEFEEAEDHKYPRSATHWISFKNEKWRCLHMRNMMIVLGASKINAQKTVEACEAKKDQDKVATAYEDAMSRLVAKHPTVGIKVREQRDMNGLVRTFVARNGETYESLESEFTSQLVYMPNTKNTTTAKVADTMGATSEDNSSDEIDLSELSF